MPPEKGSEEGSNAGGGVPFEPDEATAQKVARLAGQFVDRVRELHVALRYSDGSIAAAEEIGLRLFESLRRRFQGVQLEEARGGLADELGAYFGETFIKNHGGRWGWATVGESRVFGLRTDCLSLVQGGEAPGGR